jgi:hypothetical protein
VLAYTCQTIVDIDASNASVIAVANIALAVCHGRRDTVLIQWARRGRRVEEVWPAGSRRQAARIIRWSWSWSWSCICDRSCIEKLASVTAFVVVLRVKDLGIQLTAYRTRVSLLLLVLPHAIPAHRRQILARRHVHACSGLDVAGEARQSAFVVSAQLEQAAASQKDVEPQGFAGTE